MKHMENVLPDIPPRGIVWKLGWRSGLLQALFSPGRMQGVGFGWAVLPVILRWSRGEEDMKQRLFRHFTFFNANPYLGSIVMGSVARMEAEGQGDAVPGVKQRFSTITGALGDRLFWAHLRPMLLGLAVLLLATIPQDEIRVSIILFSLLFLFGMVNWSFRFAGVLYGWRYGYITPLRMARWPLQKFVNPMATVGALVSGLLLSSTFLVSDSNIPIPVHPSLGLLLIILVAFGKKLSPVLRFVVVWIIALLTMLYL